MSYSFESKFTFWAAKTQSLWGLSNQGRLTGLKGPVRLALGDPVCPFVSQALALSSHDLALGWLVGTPRKMGNGWRGTQRQDERWEELLEGANLISLGSLS